MLKCYKENICKVQDQELRNISQIKMFTLNRYRFKNFEMFMFTYIFRYCYTEVSNKLTTNKILCILSLSLLWKFNFSCIFLFKSTSGHFKRIFNIVFKVGPKNHSNVT